MTDRITRLRSAHRWMNDQEARLLLVNRFWYFSKTGRFSAPVLEQLMENCVQIWTSVDEKEMRNIMHRFEVKPFHLNV